MFMGFMLRDGKGGELPGLHFHLPRSVAISLLPPLSLRSCEVAGVRLVNMFDFKRSDADPVLARRRWRALDRPFFLS